MNRISLQMIQTPRLRRLIAAILAVAVVIVTAYLFRATLAGWIERGSSAKSAVNQQSHEAPAASDPKERKVLYWVDPMHPQYKSDKPGTAPDCGSDLVPVYASEDTAPEEHPFGSFKISSQKLQLIGVQYGEVSYGPLAKTLRTVGRVTYDETRIARIHPKIEGWLEQVFADFTGKFIEKNQPLVSLYSPELVATQQEFLIARKAKEYLGQSPVREAAAGSLSIYEAARERLRLWDISDDQIREIEERGKPTRTMTLYSPMKGFVLNRNAYPKQRVTPETELYAIADLSTIWVLADIYEYEAPMVKLGQTATMTLAYHPGKTFTGKVAYIYPQLDNATRTLKVRFEFPNPDLTLKPEMYADVVLRIEYGAQLSVPEEAVLDSGTEQIVFVAHEDGYFEARKVELGAKVDGRQVVLGGLKPGERIVTSGNFLIDSESRLKSAMAGMSHGGGAPAEGQPAATSPPAPRAQPPVPAKKSEASPEHRH
jgi:RND family efflux transporter MFP subunit